MGYCLQGKGVLDFYGNTQMHAPIVANYAVYGYRHLFVQCRDACMALLAAAIWKALRVK